MNHNSTKEFVVHFFKELGNQNIAYCILRGYEGLPEKTGRDIDVLVDDQSDIRNKIENLIRNQGWDIYKRNDSDGFFTFICNKIEDNTVSVIQLDFWTSLNWRGIPWCSSNEILSERRIFNGFYVPAKGSEAAVTGVKELMGRGRVKEKYYSHLQEFAKDDMDKFVRCLKPSLGEIAELLVSDFIAGDFKRVDERAGAIKKMLIKDNVGSYLKMSAVRIHERIKFIFWPKGKLVAFVGPDGSGKTTIIEHVSESLKLYYPEQRFYHMRYGIFPELKTGFGFSSMKGTLGAGAGKEVPADKNESKKVKKQKRSLLSILASWVVVIYYTTEFVCGNCIVRKAKCRGELVMYDRYYYDHFLQPTTRDLIYPIRKFLLALVAKPDMVVHLNADPDVVYARKQELRPEEIEMQNRYISRILKDVDTAFTVNTTTKGIDEISSEVFSEFVRRM